MADLENTLDSGEKMKKIILYTQPTCAPCHQAKAWLENEGIPVEIRDIRENSDYVEELIAMGSQATPTFVIGEKMLVGFKPDEVRDAWEEFGKQ